MSEVRMKLDNIKSNNSEFNSSFIKENVRYEQVRDASFEGMFLRIGVDGLTDIYRAPDQDVHWEDIDNISRLLTTSEVEILNITTNLDIEPSDSSYSVSYKVDNTDNQSSTVTSRLYVDDTLIGEMQTELERGELGRVVIMSGTFIAIRPSGSVFSVRFLSSSSGSDYLRGDILETKFRITKAQAAPVSKIDSIIANYSVTKSNDLILCDASANIIDINLPPVIDNGNLRVTFKKIDSTQKDVNIIPNGTDKIDGSNNNKKLSKPNDFMVLECDSSTGWWIVG